jgi:hypothetical protein
MNYYFQLVILDSGACFAKLVRSRQDFRGEVHNLENVSCETKSCDGLHGDRWTATRMLIEVIRLQVEVSGGRYVLSTVSQLYRANFSAEAFHASNQWPYKITATKARSKFQQLDDCSPRYSNNPRLGSDDRFHFQRLFIDLRNTLIAAC